ncbi:MAG: nucleotide exchange factor GrpE [Holosporaceae bacterium]|jgi:molecular chaperone GrpE|nr:nucleotide exchange factor GrpE [Holosporaceae bacterium]
MNEENSKSAEESEKNLGTANENLEEKADENDDRVKKLEEEGETLRNTVLRMAAESENLRKRLEKEKADAVKYANAKFAEDLLAVVDNFERIFENCPASVKDKIKSDEAFGAFFDGISLCEKELLSIFKKHGISLLKTEEGDKFNPEHHQAVCESESPDHEIGSVIRVLQKGYTCHGRLLRPAMVSVSKKHE